jgi:CheY-like chemotaxis protein
MNEVNILLVEDNEGDIILTLEALKETSLKNRVVVARNGEKALEMLENAIQLPDMILLDINLPKVDGIEVLTTIKNDHRFKAIPVIMLSTSSSDVDIKKSYENHANCFISKPVDLNRFIEVVKTIENFWISIVSLPKQQRHAAVPNN